MSARANRIPPAPFLLAMLCCAGCTALVPPVEPREAGSLLPSTPACAIGRATVCDERVRLSPSAGTPGGLSRRLGYVSEVLEVVDGAATRVRQLFGEFRHEPAPAAGSSVRGVQVHLQRRNGQPPARVLVGDAPAGFARGLYDAAFEGCLPAGPVREGDAWTLTAAQSAAWTRRLDPEGEATDRIRCTLTALRLCHRPSGGHDPAAACSPLRCAIVSVQWRHTGAVLGIKDAAVELTGTVWIELAGGLIVHRTCRGTVRRAAGGSGEGRRGEAMGTLEMTHTAWPITPRQFARYRERHGVPAGPVELPSGLIFRAAAPACCRPRVG